jgi:hypothetical protein
MPLHISILLSHLPFSMVLTLSSGTVTRKTDRTGTTERLGLIVVDDYSSQGMAGFSVCIVDFQSRHIIYSELPNLVENLYHIGSGNLSRGSWANYA